jgi:hypothetical protein
MFNPHQISERLAVLAGVSLLAALIVPSALAVELLPEGGGERQSDSVTGNRAASLDASAASYDWSAAPLVGLIGLVVLVTTLAVYYAATRRNRQLAAR